jgi:hypothetical protein
VSQNSLTSLTLPPLPPMQHLYVFLFAFLDILCHSCSVCGLPCLLPPAQHSHFRAYAPRCPKTVSVYCTGLCTLVNRRDGTTCDDGSRCTVNDVCVNGVCKGTRKCPPIRAPGACTYQGCDADTGMRACFSPSSDILQICRDSALATFISSAGIQCKLHSFIRYRY